MNRGKIVIEYIGLLHSLGNQFSHFLPEKSDIFPSLPFISNIFLHGAFYLGRRWETDLEALNISEGTDLTLGHITQHMMTLRDQHTSTITPPEGCSSTNI